jgi:hypothetical protein
MEAKTGNEFFSYSSQFSVISRQSAGWVKLVGQASSLYPQAGMPVAPGGKEK